MTKNTQNSDPSDTPTNNSSPESIAGLLTKAAEQLDSHTVAALRNARHNALARQSLHRQPALALSAGHGIYRLMPHSPQQWVIVTALLVTVLVSMAGYWHHAGERDTNHHDASQLDIAILTDDLPMDVFLD